MSYFNQAYALNTGNALAKARNSGIQTASEVSYCEETETLGFDYALFARKFVEEFHRNIAEDRQEDMRRNIAYISSQYAEFNYFARDPQVFAYLMATLWIEARGSDYSPSVKESDQSCRNKSTVSGGANFCGRGLSQLTHDYNYVKFKGLLAPDDPPGEDADIVTFESDDETHTLDLAKALIPENSTWILFKGVYDGIFTGKKITIDTIGDVRYKRSRNVINGTDKNETLKNKAEIIYPLILDSQFTKYRCFFPDGRKIIQTSYGFGNRSVDQRNREVKAHYAEQYRTWRIDMKQSGHGFI